MAVKFWPVITWALDKLPLDKMLVRPPDRKESVRELYNILKAGEASGASTKESPAVTRHPSFNPADNQEPAPAENQVESKVHLERHTGSNSQVTTAETVAWQNREIGKVLLQMERHAAQKFTIAGKKCDCGQSRHLLDLESLCEETISMVDNPDIYNKVLDYVKELGPKVTIESLESGKYDQEYTGYSVRARDLRKELLGTLEPKALFPKKDEKEEVTQ